MTAQAQTFSSFSNGVARILATTSAGMALLAQDIADLCQCGLGTYWLDFDRRSAALNGLFDFVTIFSRVNFRGPPAEVLGKLASAAKLGRRDRCRVHVFQYLFSPLIPELGS